MAYNADGYPNGYADGYYPPPNGTRQPLGTRSSSVSSSSSSTSYSAGYSAMGTAHDSISRAISPASAVPGPSTGIATYSRTHYPDVFNEHPASLQSMRSQLLQAQIARSLPLYAPESTPRPPSRTPLYGAYPVTALPQHPPPLSYQASAPLYPSFATTAYHSSPALPSYHAPQLVHRQRMMSTPEEPKESPFVKGMKRLPPEVISEIQQMVTWFHCWKAYRICRWFRENFHPDRLPFDSKVAGMLYAETNWGSYDCEESDVPSFRSERKGPPWFGCYHCFRPKGFENFELSRWGNTPPPPRETHNAADGVVTKYLTPAAEREQSRMPPSFTPSLTPQSNPHYDPTLTRTSLMAAAAASNRRSGAVTPNTVESCESAPREKIRRKDARGQRRWCIDCGLKNHFYIPGDVIDLHKPRNPRNAYWVCKCWKLHLRPETMRCLDCEMYIPFSPQSRRR